MFQLILPFEQHLVGTLRILYCTPLTLQEQVRVTAFGGIFRKLFSFVCFDEDSVTNIYFRENNFRGVIAQVLSGRRVGGISHCELNI